MKKKLLSILLAVFMVMTLAPVSVFAEDYYQLKNNLYFFNAKGDTSTDGSNLANYTAYVIAYEGEFENLPAYIESKGFSGIKAEQKYQFSASEYMSSWSQYKFVPVSEEDKISKDVFSGDKIPCVVVFYSVDGKAREYCAISASTDHLSSDLLYFDDDYFNCNKTGWKALPKTVADILDTVEGGFPTTEKTGWTDGTYSLFVDGENLVHVGNVSVAKSTVLTSSGSNYTHEFSVAGQNKLTYTFVMNNDNKLEKITINSNYGFGGDGDYYPRTIINEVSFKCDAFNFSTFIPGSVTAPDGAKYEVAVKRAALLKDGEIKYEYVGGVWDETPEKLSDIDQAIVFVEASTEGVVFFDETNPITVTVENDGESKVLTKLEGEGPINEEGFRLLQYDSLGCFLVFDVPVIKEVNFSYTDFDFANLTTTKPTAPDGSNYGFVFEPDKGGFYYIYLRNSGTLVARSMDNGQTWYSASSDFTEKIDNPKSLDYNTAYVVALIKPVNGYIFSSMPTVKGNDIVLLSGSLNGVKGGLYEAYNSDNLLDMYVSIQFTSPDKVPDTLTITKADGSDAIFGKDYKWECVNDGFFLEIISDNLTISGTDKTNNIMIETNHGVSNLTIKNLNLEISREDSQCIRNLDSITINVLGDNSLTSTGEYGAITYVDPYNVNIVLTGSGNLTATTKGEEDSWVFNAKNITLDMSGNLECIGYCNAVSCNNLIVTDNIGKAIIRGKTNICGAVDFQPGGSATIPASVAITGSSSFDATESNITEEVEIREYDDTRRYELKDVEGTAAKSILMAGPIKEVAFEYTDFDFTDFTFELPVAPDGAKYVVDNSSYQVGLTKEDNIVYYYEDGQWTDGEGSPCTPDVSKIDKAFINFNIITVGSNAFAEGTVKVTAKKGTSSSKELNAADLNPFVEGFELDNINKIECNLLFEVPEAITIADILATNPDFPTTFENAWRNPSNPDALAFNSNFGENDLAIMDTGLTVNPLTNEIVALSGSNYVYTFDAGTITFNMTNNKLSSITFAHDPSCGIDYSPLDGTYAPVVDYEITQGNKVTINVSDNKDVLFTSNADFSKFKEVKVDNTTVNSSNYKAESGSTKVTLKVSYLSTLANGKHTLEIVSSDGSASTTFTITRNNKPSPTPNPAYIVPNTSVR